MAKEQAPNAPKNEQTTGHEWDGIQEYNHPLPMWWLWIFAICVLFAIGYVIYYPAIPMQSGATKGVGGWSQYNQLSEQLEKSNAKKEVFESKIAKMSTEQIAKDQDLYHYAIAAGRTEFALQCSQCHGAGGGGAKGFPNLLDDEWIWGGKLEDIAYTITHGIRSTSDDPESRDMGPMLAFGKDEVLTEEEITDVIHYLKVLAYKFPSTESSDRGMEIFEANCTACHQEGGIGNRELGAPPLNNAVWLYGGDSETLHETIFNGRGGVMPAFGLKLDENTIKKLALYVHSLGGGE